MTTPEEKIIKQGVNLLGEIITQDVANKGAMMIKELLKHAQACPPCIECKQLLRAMGVNSEKSYEENVSIAKTMFPDV